MAGSGYAGCIAPPARNPIPVPFWKGASSDGVRAKPLGFPRPRRARAREAVAMARTLGPVPVLSVLVLMAPLAPQAFSQG